MPGIALTNRRCVSSRPQPQGRCASRDVHMDDVQKLRCAANGSKSASPPWSWTACRVVACGVPDCDTLRGWGPKERVAYDQPALLAWQRQESVSCPRAVVVDGFRVSACSTAPSPAVAMAALARAHTAAAVSRGKLVGGSLLLELGGWSPPSVFARRVEY